MEEFKTKQNFLGKIEIQTGVNRNQTTSDSSYKTAFRYLKA